ncbi:YciI family protein, partial [Streptomyces virginiae]
RNSGAACTPHHRDLRGHPSAGPYVPTNCGTQGSDGKISYTDGPFTETKEVVGGYSLSQCKDKAEAIEWTRRFLEIHPVEWKISAEVREIQEM